MIEAQTVIDVAEVILIVGVTFWFWLVVAAAASDGE
jgi:hypothetical protein